MSQRPLLKIIAILLTQMTRIAYGILVCITLCPVSLLHRRNQIDALETNIVKAVESPRIRNRRDVDTFVTIRRAYEMPMSEQELLRNAAYEVVRWSSSLSNLS